MVTRTEEFVSVCIGNMQMKGKYTETKIKKDVKHNKYKVRQKLIKHRRTRQFFSKGAEPSLP